MTHGVGNIKISIVSLVYLNIWVCLSYFVTLQFQNYEWYMDHHIIRHYMVDLTNDKCSCKILRASVC
jgi:hypothetical protein